MDLQDFNKQFASKMSELSKFIEGEKIRDIMGSEAVDHFQKSFKNEGFTDDVLEPWQDVKRRDPNSPWYGHNRFASKEESTNKNQQRLQKKNSGTIGIFSQERTTAPILKGGTSDLRNSIRYMITDKGVRVLNSTPYASVHQFGKMAKIYGKKSFQMPARPFMGKSILLKNNIENKIYKEIKKIIT